MTTKKFKIGEFSKKVGVSPDILKYQEQFGILEPQLNENSDYRYYYFSQTARVYESLIFRNLGFNSREIKTLVAENSAEEILHQVNRQTVDYRQQMMRLSAYLEVVEKWNTAVRYVNQESPWFIREIPGFYFLPHGRNRDFIEDERISSMIKDWAAWLPVVSLDQRIPLGEEMRSYFFGKADEVREEPESYWGFKAGEILVEQGQIRTDEPVLHVPACRCLEYYQKMPIRQQPGGAGITQKEVFAEQIEIIRKNHLEIRGDIHQQILFYSNEKTGRYIYSVSTIPIR